MALTCVTSARKGLNFRQGSNFVRGRQTWLPGWRWAWLLLLAACIRGTIGAEFDQGPVLTIMEENDFVNGTDRWYTQGGRIVYLQGDNTAPRWVTRLFEHVPTAGFTAGAERFGYQLGQSIFTSSKSSSLLEDRPFAGWLYTGLIFQRRGLGLDQHLTLENFQMDIGIIGPESLAGQMQTWYHDRTPRGWRDQIKDEPGIALKYGRAWLFSIPSKEARYVDVIPQGGLSVGNVDTSFRVGTMLRAGWNLPEDFGVQPIESLIATEGGWSPSRAGRRWGFYLFTRVEGRAVAYTAFLDGNAFRESRHVDKEVFVGEFRTGIVLVLDRIEVAYTHVFRSREFEEQPKGHVFGSIVLKCKF